MKLNSTAVVMGIALALFLGPRPAAAWTSGPEETPGPQEARNVWSWARAKSAPANEHAELLKRAFEQAGLPAPLFPSPSEPFKARVFTEGGTTNGGLPSFIPAPLSNAKAIATRSYTLPGFAALPDHSYALWDWASGNERCPIDTVAGTDLDGEAPEVACHTFSSHLGILNSTHFPPQSENTYRWYHTLALKRAEECKTLDDNFKAAVIHTNPDQWVLIDAMVKECEREALVIEAVGQHFLQDAWAMGHMWERWGTPFLSGFTNVDESSSIKEERRARGVFVAAVAGLIHGADSLLRKIPLVEGGDQMSFGRSRDVNWRQLPGDPLQGIGDIYADLLFSDSDLDYAIQSSRLLNCSASGVIEVYSKTAMVSGESTGRATVNPVGPECFSQRATNLAIWEGFGVNIVLPGIGVPVRVGLANPIVTSLITGVVTPKTLSSTAKSALFAELRTDMTRLGAFVELRKKAAPTDVDLANLGLSPDGFFMLTGRNGLLTQNQDDPPAPYADPGREANPSHLQDPDTHARYIARVFNKAHVADWCIDDEADPKQLQKRVVSATPAERPAAYEACVEFTERHVRLGSMSSICEAATASSLPNSFMDTTGATDVKTAAARFCRSDKVATSGGRLNDTGITAGQCYQAGSDALVACGSAGAIALNNAQDGMTGRDADPATNGNADGKLGFSFSTVPGGCVQDNVTGLMWEVKTTDGGLRDWNKTYTNYSATYNPSNLYGSATDASGFVSAVNATNLCGYNDWRLPTADELQSIVDYGAYLPAVDVTWFPNTQGSPGSRFWSASPQYGYPPNAWYVYSTNGVVSDVIRYVTFYVRVVRAGQ